MEFIRDSRNWFYIQTTDDGLIVDANNHFIQSYLHISPEKAQHIVVSQDIRKLIVTSERAKRGDIVSCQIRTRQSDDSTQWSLWEMAYVKGYFIAQGIDLFPAFESGSGELQRQYALLRTIIWKINHGMRKPVANIKGLIPIIKDQIDPMVADMLITAINNLDDEFHSLIKKFGKVRK
jgi:hypothetical protein